jgi:hypothetical protein
MGQRYDASARPVVGVAVSNRGMTRGTAPRHGAAPPCPARARVRWNPLMTEKDVLIERAYQEDGRPLTASPGRRHHAAEEIWHVTAAGRTRATVHPFTDALDLALAWASESGGEIYRQESPDREPELYKPSA